MFQDLIIRKLQTAQKNSTPDKLARNAMIKLQKQKRLSSQEFLLVQETIWQPGPKINYINPENSKRIS